MNPTSAKKVHWAIFIDNSSDKTHFIESVLDGNPPSELSNLKEQKGALFSKLALEQFMLEEDRHDIKVLTRGVSQSLRSHSSGEQKKALLKYILNGIPDFIVLDNPFDNLDTESQEELAKRLEKISARTTIIQILSRRKDLLPFVTHYSSLKKRDLRVHENPIPTSINRHIPSLGDIPAPLQSWQYKPKVLVDLKNVSVQFGDKRVLDAIDWKIEKGEFWQLMGKNGSGKTTILSMITGENPKGYGQELYIFGHKKGSGESVWELKEKMGYFTPAMTDKFTGYHTLEHMIVSGLTDSIGLYTRPTEAQLRLAAEWLRLIGLWDIKDTHFHNLTMGQQRLIMTVRAMVKHPLLLILDEPTAGLDDTSADLLVALVNKMASESDTAIIFVSHRKEPGLNPDFVYELQMTPKGSRGTKKPS
ncbi:ATP-binding cassette domain-containing protein [Ulvibacterium marinum]|uniref:ATP-binding cassette domain-containing protein n=1 Tax=Ulvibacterium marinum TaxID=2419782 RepID=UPI002494CCF8|nr:ATP-binding cassette domain-containing protein [Ulvibacterium marinum]